MSYQRMRDLMDFVADHSGDRTHPDGCMAVTFDDGLELIAWPVLVNLCPHAHPLTYAELTQQYADNGWVNIDVAPGLHDKCSDEFGWCSLCRPGGRGVPPVVSEGGA